jgi:hypothetical protein
MSEQAHATLGASSAHRWLACPGSVELIQELALPESSSSFADEGTAAHSLASSVLLAAEATDLLGRAPATVAEYAAHLTAEELLGTVIGPQYADYVDENMFAPVQEYVDYVRDLPGWGLVEQQVSVGKYVFEGFGTADSVKIDGDTCYVTDLKYGKGIPVSAANNVQLMYYALGVWEEHGYLYDFTKFVLTIHQPRKDSVSVWEVSVEDLLAWAKEVLAPGALAALVKGAPRTPTAKACQFCPAAGRCDAQAEWALDLSTEAFHDLEHIGAVKSTEGLTHDQIGELLMVLPAIKKWTDQVSSAAYAAAMCGEQIPGHKLIETLGNRRWADPEAAARALVRVVKTTGAYKQREIITITAAEKLLGKKHRIMEAHVRRPEGPPALVANSHKAKPLIMNPAEGFEDATAGPSAPELDYI